jgi:hypothetical protein
MNITGFFQNSKTLLALGGVGFISLIVLIVMFSLSAGDLIETPNVPKEEWERRVESQEGDETTRVVNNYDGYAITVPTRWQTPSVASPGESGLKIYYHPGGFTPSGIEPPEGMFLHIYTQTKDAGQSMAQWVTDYTQQRDVRKTTIGNYETYWVDDPLMDFEGMTTNLVPIPNTTRHSYFIASGETVFGLSCLAEGAEHIQWVALCEGVLDTFEILQ